MDEWPVSTVFRGGWYGRMGEALFAAQLGWVRSSADGACRWHNDVLRVVLVVLF